MNLFGKSENHKENQLEIYEELLKEKQEEFDALKDTEGSPQADVQRKQLSEEIKQIKLSIEQVKENAERSNEQDLEQGQDGLDLFED